jgi:EF hand
MMNTMFKVATLSTLLACGAAFAQDPGPPAQPEQTPPARPADPIPAPSDETMPENTTSPSTQTMSSDGRWQDFRTADANGDGYVSKNEAEANPTLIEVFTEVDADQNGSLSSGEYDEARRQYEGQGPGEEEPKERS